MSTPNTGIPYVPEGTLDLSAGINQALNVIDALLQTAVLSMALTDPPVTPPNGSLYIVATPATGAWAGQENNLARYVTEGDFWQFFVAGAQVSIVLNRDDGGLYAFDSGSSPGAWALAAGLSDAPIDGSLYARRDGAWEAFTAGGGSLTIQDSDSPPTVAVDASVLIVANGLVLTEVSAGVARIEAGPVAPPPVVNTAAANLDATDANAGDYTRFSHAAPTYTFDDAETYEVGAEYHGRYVGAGSLMVTEDGGMTVNPPAGGTLEVPPGGTFTVKIVAADEADLIGVTVPV